MASPGQLVKTMAKALGISPSTVQQYDRLLAEAGLRTKLGRGTSAAQVTAEDAANLLIAIAAAPIAGPTVNEAVNACTTYGALPRASDRESHRAFAKFGMRGLSKLPKEHSLHDAITILIRSTALGEVWRFPKRMISPWTGKELEPGLYIHFDSPIPGARMRLFRQPTQFKPVLSYLTSGPLRNYRGLDLSQTRTVTHKTIRMLGNLLSEKPSAKG